MDNVGFLPWISSPVSSQGRKDADLSGTPSLPFPAPGRRDRPRAARRAPRPDRAIPLREGPAGSSLETRGGITDRAIRALAILSVASIAAGALFAGAAQRPPSFSRFHLATPSVPGGARYSVFLPPSYSTGNASYPVLYFLHDAFGDDRVLWRHGVVSRLDAAMRAGTVPEFLIVCPDGDGSWFSNSHDGRRRYEDFVASDLPREVERRFRVLPGRDERGIAGISMGGYAAMKIALHHPADFGSVSGLSAAVIPMGWKDVEKIFFLARWQIHRVFGRSSSDNSLAENDVWRLLMTKEKWDAPFDVFLLAGTSDKYRLDHVAAQYADFLNRHGIRATARLEPGIHDWPYWRDAMLEIARWHGAHFAAVRSPR